MQRQQCRHGLMKRMNLWTVELMVVVARHPVLMLLLLVLPLLLLLLLFLLLLLLLLLLLQLLLLLPLLLLLLLHLRPQLEVADLGRLPIHSHLWHRGVSPRRQVAVQLRVDRSHQRKVPSARTR